MSINKPNVREVLKGKYPAKLHAKKVKEWIVANGGDAEGVVYLEGQKTKMNEVSSWLCFHVASIVNRSIERSRP